MNVLVLFEESGALRDRFIDAGHNIPDPRRKVVSALIAEGFKTTKHMQPWLRRKWR